MLNQAQWPQPSYLLLPVWQIALRESVQNSSASPMPLEALADEIDRDGLREPIAVRHGKNGYVIVHGNRRLLACRMLGWHEIPARLEAPAIRDLLTSEELFRALRSRDLEYPEQAEAVVRLNEEFSVSRADIARLLGDSTMHVMTLHRIGHLDASCLQLLREKRLPERIAAAITRLPEAQDRLHLLQKAAQEKLDIREVELLIASTLHQRVSTSGDTPAPCAVQPGLPEQTNRRRVQSLIRDVRPYLNTLRNVTRQMQSAGYTVDFSERTENGSTTLTIRVPRPRRRQSVK